VLGGTPLPLRLIGHLHRHVKDAIPAQPEEGRRRECVVVRTKKEKRRPDGKTTDRSTTTRPS
jgi:ribosomal protein L14